MFQKRNKSLSFPILIVSFKRAILARTKILLSGLLARLVGVVVVDQGVGADVAVPCELVISTTLMWCHVNMWTSSVYKQLQKFSTLCWSVVLLLCVISSIQYLQSFDPKYKCRKMLSSSSSRGIQCSILRSLYISIHSHTMDQQRHIDNRVRWTSGWL